MFRFYRNVNKFYAEYGSFALGALLATGITISALPETILLNKKRNIFAYLDEDKKEKSIDKKLDERIEKVKKINLLAKFNTKNFFKDSIQNISKT